MVRLSGFNVYVGDYPAPGMTLVYNTFSGGFVELDGPTLAAVRKADAGGALDADEQALIDPDFFDDAVGIAVESRKVEEQAYRDWHERMRSRPDTLEVMISTTFACNFDCTYCCQSDVLDGTTMKDDLGRATAVWVAERAKAIGATRVELQFVGGEPLLHPHRIEQIVHDVASGLAGVDVSVHFVLITNGYYLTRELVERWRPLGLRGAQVTLDGDETTHGITRRSKKKGEDTYARIFANIVGVSHLIDITLNGNYQDDTVHGFVPLLTKLRAAGFKRGSRVTFSPALAALGAPSDAASGSCLWSGSNAEVMIGLADEIWKSGFRSGDPASIGPCSFHRRHSLAIDPEGHIYKCPGFLGKPEWAVGHVASGLTARYDRLAQANPQRVCGTCAHRPDCAGGCIAAEWLNRGREEGVNCEITYLERNRDELVKRKYLLATTESPEDAAARFPPPRVEIPRAPRRRSPLLKVVTAA